MNDTNTPAPSRRPRYLNIIKLVFAGLLAAFVISKTNPDQFRAVLVRLSASEVLLYFGLFVLATMVKAFQYRIVIGKDVAYPRVLNVVVMQNFVSNFLAASAGIASYLSLFKVEHGVKVSRAMATFILTKVGDLIAIACLLALSVWWVWPEIGVLRGPSIILLAGIILFLLFIFGAVILRQKFIALIRIILERLNLLQYAFIQKGMDVLDALVNQNPKNILEKIKSIIAGSFLYMMVTLAWLYTGLRIFDVQLSLGGFAFSSALYYILSYLPIYIFGGLGVTETSLLYLYGLFLSSQAELAAVLIGLRILNYLMNLVVLLYLPLYQMLWRKPGNADG